MGFGTAVTDMGTDTDADTGTDIGMGTDTIHVVPCMAHWLP